MCEHQLTGLSQSEAAQRRARGEGGDGGRTITKSRGQIVRENLFTLFNLLSFLIAGLLLAVGAYSNMLFLAIIILNIVIGTAQELKAKKLVDELSLLNRPRIRVLRDAKEQILGQDEIVMGDLMVLQSGDQICSDSAVISGTVEVNESLLTGESDAVVKEAGSHLLSGSFVTAGKAYAQVEHVGEENYTARLANEVKKEKQVNSELLGSMRKVTHFTSFLIIPLGVFLFAEAFFLRYEAAETAVVSSAAALLGMLPKGLVLLISVSLAAGVIRLAKMKILVQNIYSLETLAHVDTLCLDKTGTITDGKLNVRSVIALSEVPEEEARRLAGSYMNACQDNNATFQALRAVFQGSGAYAPAEQIPFSSKRKWGCISFDQKGTVFVGAPERLLGGLSGDLAQALEEGYRVIAVGYVNEVWKDDTKLPEGIQPLYAVILEDTIRPHAREALEFFRTEGVDVKVISGDHVKTVSRIAQRAGLHRWRDAVDLFVYGGGRQLREADYDLLCRKYAVFARVTPGQKQEIVKALKRQGYQVAMTGDGVNDLLALREADCSIAVADGSEASRQIAQVFFIKTIYSVLVSLFCLFANQPFPFIPIQITLVDACIEAYPSFLTILESDTRRIRDRFLTAALRHAAPFGTAVAAEIALISLTAALPEADKQTVMYVILIVISMTAVLKSCYPLSPLRIFVCVTMVIGTFGALMILPALFRVTRISAVMESYILIGGGAALLLALLVEMFLSLKDYGKRKETAL